MTATSFVSNESSYKNEFLYLRTTLRITLGISLSFWDEASSSISFEIPYITLYQTLQQNPRSINSESVWMSLFFTSTI